MNKKYELIEHTNYFTLYQIKALIDIPERDVKAGDLGGYIEFENNLSHEGLCWVGNGACVYGNARVFGNGWVYGKAHVYDNAKIFDNASVHGEAIVHSWGHVCGNAQVFGDARLYGAAWVFGNAQVYGNAKVYEKARIYDRAEVFDFANVYAAAWVYGQAQVYGDGLIYGYAHVCGSAKLYGNTKLYAHSVLTGGNWSKTPIAIIGSRDYVCQCNIYEIKIGCHVLTFDEWLEQYEEIGKEQYYNNEEIKEYKSIIDFIINTNKPT